MATKILLKRYDPFSVRLMQGDAAGQKMTSWNGVLLILATLLVTCIPVLAFDYGYADDFWFLSMRPLDAETISKNVHVFLNQGRPLCSIWALGVMGLANSIQDLKYVRLVTLFGLFFCSLVFYKLIRRHLVEDRLQASLIACFFSINPSFLIMAGWANIGYDAYACLLGLASIYVLLRDARFDAEFPETDTLFKSAPIAGMGWAGLSVSALLLFATLCIYQPGAMLFWTGTCIWIIGRFTARREDWLKLARIAVVFFGVLAAYFLISKTMSDPDSRFHVSVSIIRRMGWFVLFPLKNALCYPLIQPLDVWSIAALLLLSLGLWRFCRQTSRSMWIPPLILAISPLTVLPTIFAYGHYDVSRTRPALYGLIIVVWYTVFSAIARYFKNAFILGRILIPILVVLILSGQYHLQRYFIMPQLWEESALFVKLQEYVRENPKLDRLIVLWAPRGYPPITEFQGVDEMGFASLSRRGAPQYEIWQVLAGVTNQKYEDLAGVKILPIYSDEYSGPNPVIPPDAFIIDLRQLRTP